MRFFGHDPQSSIEETGEQIFIFDYSGTALRYLLLICPEKNEVLISGDTSIPFGADSLYEISILCDAIETFPDPYYEGQTALGFWDGPLSVPKNRCLTIMKRPDGDLKVWPR